MKQLIYRGVFGCIFAVLLTPSYAQINPKDSIVFAPLLSFHYGYYRAAGDMSERFGNFSMIGGSFMIKNRHNWLFGGTGNFMFGTEVKEDPLSDYRVEQGLIIAEIGTYATMVTQQRGFTAMLNVGKIFPVFGPNDNSGIEFTVGVGILQHKIRYQVERNTVPWLRDDYAHGFDRLTNGFALSQSLGYRYFGNNRLLNLFIGVEVFEAFTKNRRAYNTDQKSTDNSSRTDLSYGVKVGWTIPLYKKTPREFYYN